VCAGGRVNHGVVGWVSCSHTRSISGVLFGPIGGNSTRSDSRFRRFPGSTGGKFENQRNKSWKFEDYIRAMAANDDMLFHGLHLKR